MMKKLSQASPSVGIRLSLPQAKPRKISPKKGKAMARTPFMDGPRYLPLVEASGWLAPALFPVNDDAGSLPTLPYCVAQGAGLSGRPSQEETAMRKPPRDFFKPLAIGAPQPWRELPVRLERMIHFVPPQIEKMRAKIPDLAKEVDVILGNLEDAIPVDQKVAARQGFISMARDNDFGQTGLWVRVNALNSPWVLDDVVEIVGAVGDRLDVIMLPKVEGPWDIHYLDQ